MKKKIRNLILQFSSSYRRMRSMPWRSAIRYIVLSILKKSQPAYFSVLGFGVYMRPGSTDLRVACESLGAELEPAISYLPNEFDGTIIDAGGYIGTSAIKLARAFPDARVLTIEPNESNYRLLKKNVENYKNIFPMQAAVSNYSGPGRLLDRQTGNWGFTIQKNPNDSPHAKSISECQIISMGDFLEAHGVSEIGILKVDIEGAEMQLLECAAAWLEHTDLLIIELHEFIVPGVEKMYRKVTSGRANIKLNGEKHVSIRRVKSAFQS